MHEYLVVGVVGLSLGGDVELLPEGEAALHHVLDALVAPEVPANGVQGEKERRREGEQVYFTRTYTSFTFLE